MNLNIGSVIKRLRMEHSVTQEELAGYLGISYQAVSKWENETTMPDITLLPKLAAFFGIKIMNFFLLIMMMSWNGLITFCILRK